MQLLYSLIWWLLLPFILIYRLIKDLRAGLNWERFLERVAIYQQPLKPSGILIHAVSLGEVRAASSLIEALLIRYPQATITVTTTTLTGSAQVLTSFSDRVQHLFLPLDHPRFISKFLKHLQPQLILIMETELWPAFINQANIQKIPVCIINARLSERSYLRYQKIKTWLCQLLKPVFIYAQSESDVQRFQSLGLKSVICMGNLKYELNISSKIIKQADEYRYLFSNRKVWLVASTHQGEDEQILNCFSSLQAVHPNLLLILAPRHPERFLSVEKLIQNTQLPYLKRSNLNLSHCELNEQAILLMDSIGELLLFFPNADIVTIAGSLVPKGGHNILEAAYFGKPIVVGEYMFHFQEIFDDFKSASALLVANSQNPLQSHLEYLLNNEVARLGMGQKARMCYVKKQGALNFLLNKIEELYQP